MIVGVVNTISATNEKFAFILNGGGSRDKNYTRYWYDCSAVYQTLINKGYSTSNVYLAMSDGTMTNYAEIPWVNNNLSYDLDGDGNNETLNIATHVGIENIFDQLAGQMTGDDDLFIYVTGPGSRNPVNGHSYILLWDEDSISDEYFAQMLAQLNYRTINVVMQQSYAGGFSDYLTGIDNIVISTACDKNEKSLSMPTKNYGKFTYYWLCAINGSAPDTMYPYHNTVIIETSGDANVDGYVTMEEAFNYAYAYDHTSEHPQISSYPGCLSRALALNQLLYSNDCSAALIEGWDLYMQDNPGENGNEPNISVDEYWLTEDIWFEENGVNVDKLQSGHTYDFCVRVRNRGVETSPNDAVLYAHWTKSRIGGGWPWGWDGTTYKCNGTPVRRGDLVGYVTLPPIDGGQTYIARIPWTTPSNGEFSPCFEFSGDYLNELWHYCVLARIVDSQEQPDETITDMDFVDFVLDFNNVVSRNVTIMDVQSNNHLNMYSTGVVGIANPRYAENCGPYTMQFDTKGIDDLSHFADVTLTFPSSFLNSHTYMTWQNCSFNNLTNKFYLADSARFNNIYFDGNDNNFYPLVLDVEYIDYLPELFYDIEISLILKDAAGEFVGGEKFKLWNYPSYMTNNIKSRDIPVEETNIEQNPNMPKDDVINMDVYNAQGQLLMRTTSENIKTMNLPGGIYILRSVGEGMHYSVKIIK